MGQASGRAKRQKQLNLARVENELGALDSLDDAQRWVRRLCLWGAGGLLPGAVLGACCRCVEMWMRANEGRITREVVDQLRSRIHELEGQMKARAAGAGR